MNEAFAYLSVVAFCVCVLMLLISINHWVKSTCETLRQILHGETKRAQEDEPNDPTKDWKSL